MTMPALHTIVLVTFFLGALSGLLIATIGYRSRYPFLTTPVACLVVGTGLYFSYDRVLMLAHKAVFG